MVTHRVDTAQEDVHMLFRKKKLFPLYKRGDEIGTLAVLSASSYCDDAQKQELRVRCSCGGPSFTTTNKRIANGASGCTACVRAKAIREKCHVNVTRAEIMYTLSVAEEIRYAPGVKQKAKSKKYGKIVARVIQASKFRHPCEACIYWEDDCSTVDCVLEGQPVVWRPSRVSRCKGIKLNVSGPILLHT